MSLKIRIKNEDYEVNEEQLQKFKSMHRYFPEEGHWKLLNLSKNRFYLINIDKALSIKEIKENIESNRKIDEEIVYKRIYDLLKSKEIKKLEEKISNELSEVDN